MSLDPLIVAKLHFFRHIVSLLKTPAVLSISSDLYFVMKQVINIIILKEVLYREVTAYKLINIDLSKKDIFLPLNNLNLGTATKLALQNS